MAQDLPKVGSEKSQILDNEVGVIRLIGFAALFATFEENMCWTSGVRQVAPPEMRTIITTMILVTISN